MHYPEKRCSPLFTLHQSDRTPIATTWRRVNHYAARWSVNVSFLESTNYFINTFYTIQNFVEKLKLKLIYITWIIFYVQFYDYKFLNTAKWETEKWIAIFTSIYLFICTSIEKWEFMLFVLHGNFVCERNYNASRWAHVRAFSTLSIFFSWYIYFVEILHVTYREIMRRSWLSYSCRFIGEVAYTSLAIVRNYHRVSQLQISISWIKIHIVDKFL